jgi:uncharacterized protein YsxB (DUF464 family)
MKITIEEMDNRWGAIPHRKVTYGTEDELDVAEDWTYIFEHLKHYIYELKKQKPTNIGIQLTLQSKINKLESLLEKYKSFVELSQDVVDSSL